MKNPTSVGLLIVAAAVWMASPAYGQEDRCAFLCAPQLKIEPTITFEPLIRRPTIEELADGQVVGRSQPKRMRYSS